MIWYKYSKDKMKELNLVVRFGNWKASNEPNIIRDNIHIFPMLNFWFNDYQFSIGFAWLNFSCYLYVTSWKKRQKLEDKRLVEMYGY